MKLWIENQTYEAHDLVALDLVADRLVWLQPVVSFLKFWFSTQAAWETQTSGSTSNPKPILISRKKIEASARLTIRHFDLNPPNDGLILCLSARHVGGFMVLVRGLLAGLDVWLLEPSSAPLPEINPLLRHKKWFISLVPMQLEQLASTELLRKASTGWKGILLGGAPLSTQQTERVTQVQCPVYQSYGMTETVSHVAVRQIHPASEPIGRIPYSALQGINLKADASDCLLIQGEVTGGEWLRTNDRVEMMGKSRFRYLGRADDLINSGGIKIDPEKLKVAFARFMEIREESLVILGQPDAVLGERVVAVLAGFVALDLEDKMQKIRAIMDVKHLPKAIYTMDSFPFTPTLKINKPVILERIAVLQPIWPNPSPQK